MIMMALGRRKRLLLGAGALVLVAAMVAWRGLRVSELARIGTGYAAEQTCACLFISGRTLASCKTDLDPFAQRFISVHPGSDEVTASCFGLATATAHHDKGLGCSLRN
jgi:hypothetical protein